MGHLSLSLGHNQSIGRTVVNLMENNLFLIHILSSTRFDLEFNQREKNMYTQGKFPYSPFACLQQISRW